MTTKGNNPFMGEKLDKILRTNMMTEFEQQPVIPFVMYEFSTPTSEDIVDPTESGPLTTWAAMRFEFVKKDTAIRLQIRPDVTKELLLLILQDMVTMIKEDYENLQIRVLTNVMGADEKLKNAH